MDTKEKRAAIATLQVVWEQLRLLGIALKGDRAKTVYQQQLTTLRAELETVMELLRK